MSKDSSVRRNIIKNVFIIFLVILLLLTFFSNTILNYSLPEVSAQYPRYGTLSSAVKASGTVKANASYHVIYEEAQAEADGGLVQSRKVLSVYVKEGDIVQKDAPILQLQGGASQQLDAVQKQYDELKSTYDLALLDDGINALTAKQTLDDAKKAISDTENKITELKAEYSALLGGTDNTAVIEGRIEYLEEQIEALDEYISECQADIADVKSKISQAENMIEQDILSNQTVSEKLAAAEEEFRQLSEAYEMLKYDVEYYSKQLEDIKAAQSDIGEANSLTNQLRSLEDQLYDLEKQYDRAEEDYREERREYLKAINELKLELYAMFDELGKLEGELNDEQLLQKETLESQIESLTDQIEAQENALAKFDKQYDRAEEDRMENILDIKDQIRDIRNKLEIIGMPEVDDVIDYATGYDLAEAQKAYDNANAKLNEIKTEYEEAKAKVESLRKQSTAEGTAEEYRVLLTAYEEQLEKLQADRKSLNKQLTEANKDLSGTSAPKDPEDVQDEIKAAEESLAKLKTQLQITEATQNRADASVKAEREKQKKQLEDLAAKIEAYQNAPASTDVKAPIAGRIVSINFVPGDTVTSGNNVASIEIADKGYICEISMDMDEARKIQVGAPCTIANSWWYSNIEASVAQIRSDPQSQGKKRIITIEVKGDVHEGQSLTFSIGDKSQSYDTVLPNSAIREDNDGKFVLVVDSKNTPLSVRYTARRVAIEVIASDDTQSAISGLYGSEFVITNSTTPISDKQQVRLAET